MQKSKIFKIAGLFVGGVFLVFLIFVGYTYARIKSGDFVKFRGEWYTREEFNKYIEEKREEEQVEAKNECRKVYAKFRKAILEDKIDAALKYIKKSERAQYEIILHNPNRLEEYKMLPESKEVHKNEKISYTNIANYYYKTKDGKYVRTISFWKNFEGYWRIEYI